MFTSSRYSYLALRLGLAAVFLCFGIDKMVHPSYWLNAWVPKSLLDIVEKFSVTGTQFIYLNGIFEILVGFSLLTGVLNKFFSILAIVFIVLVLIFSGVNEITIRDFGLIGGFVSVFLWPENRNRF